MSPVDAATSRRWPAWLAFVGVLALLALACWYRQGPFTYVGDEPTYLAMTASLAEDGDFAVREEDRLRFERLFGDVSRPLIVQRIGSRVFYSKPIVYPVLAAPFYRLLGPAGLILLNVLAMAVAIWLARGWLGRMGRPASVDWTWVTVLGAGVLLPYTGWLMSDAVQFACALAGAVLAVGGIRSAVGTAPPRVWLDGAGAVAIGGVLLGLLVTLRYPNGLVLIAVVGALAAAGRGRRALGVMAAAAATLALVAALTWLATGTANPYGAQRTSVRSSSAFPSGDADAAALERFDEHPARHHLDVRARMEPRTSVYAALYFLIGRHTGLFVYFPATLVLLVLAMRRGGPVSWWLVGGFVVLALFYLAWTPRNYFGGGTFLGNRYILPAIPLLLLALPRLPRPRVWIPVWLVALLGAGSAAISMAQPEVGRGDVQSHAYAGLFRLLPYESVAQSIGGGRRDRYWAGDLVRFVDPFALRRERRFLLPAETARPAELMLATHRDSPTLVLEVRSPEPRIDLEIRDWRRTRRLQLDTADRARGAIVGVELSRPWRRHPFWWQRRPAYAVRMVRLQAFDSEGRPAAARITYLGDGSMLAGLRREVLAVEVPARGGIGEFLPLRVELRNSSPVAWIADGVAPVHLVWRLVPSDTELPVATGRLSLPATVRSGSVVEVTGAIPLAEVPGAFRLHLDLALGEIRRFEDVLGEPVATVDLLVEGVPGRLRFRSSVGEAPGAGCASLRPSGGLQWPSTPSCSRSSCAPRAAQRWRS